MYSTEIATFLGSLQKLSVDEYMLYSVVLLQGCGLMYKVVMWRLGCGKKKKVAPGTTLSRSSSNDVEKQLDRIVVVQPVESKKVHSITMEQEDDTSKLV